jgi:hypothetical protein
MISRSITHGFTPFWHPSSLNKKRWDFVDFEQSIYDPILGGSLPPAKMKLVQAWIEIHRDDLMANWKLAVSGEPLFKIEPLR